MNWFREYKNSLKMAEVEEVVDLFIYRPLAFLLVISIYNTKIKPDHLTLAAMVMGIIGGFYYSSGTREGCIAGSICYLAFNIFDCSDGQLARIKKNGSSIGRLLDGIADYIAAIAVYVGIAAGFSNQPDQPSSFVLLMAIAGISIIIQESLVDYFRTRFLDVVLQRQDTFDEGMEEYRREYENLKKQKGMWFSKFVVLIYLIYSQIQRNLTAKKKKVKFVNTTPENYFKKNHIIIRFWVLMGPSAKITTLIICSLFLRFDIFFWIVIGGFNILALSLWIIQYRIDKNLVAFNL
jgi:phosphatidylglycerophosphate synthase